MYEQFLSCNCFSNKKSHSHHSAHLGESFNWTTSFKKKQELYNSIAKYVLSEQISKISWSENKNSRSRFNINFKIGWRSKNLWLIFVQYSLPLCNQNKLLWQHCMLFLNCFFSPPLFYLFYYYVKFLCCCCLCNDLYCSIKQHKFQYYLFSILLNF